MAFTNGTLIQYFHWYISDQGILWDEVNRNAAELAANGFTGIWLPPAYKGLSGQYDVGYGVYDLYDLGEFDQKNSIRTKYGTKQQYLEAIRSLQQAKIQVYADAVLNHKMGGDTAELMKATPFSQDNRITPKGGMQEIKSYTAFTFPGRSGKYSNFEWHWWHFDAVDYNDYDPSDRSTIYLLEGKTFDDYVALEKGNFAYLMGCDLDCQHADVRNELINWGKWYLDTTGVDGFRLDAIKHIAAWFFPEWIDALEKHAGKDLFVVGEYWSPDIQSLHWYIDLTSGRMSVFDVPLHYNFHYASKTGRNYDLRRILDGTLMQQRPTHAVTFVENHDSQPLQALESVVEPWFKPLAYAFILLRQEGYPCVFYADYYGAEYRDRGRDGNQYHIVMPSHRWLLDRFLKARQQYAYGEQINYMDHPNCIGWTRLGDIDHPKTMAVLMSNGTDGYKWMRVGKPNTVFTDLTQHIPYPVTTNNDGWGQFFCKGGSVSVWVEGD
ncbi:alpha-amylase [Alkalinema pantanalense CENA528]|uniref:alpha-amylase n=1 Tax=Alkalinema pantanalense TaxID=1620705 RepID=UPI003D6E60FE